MKALWVGLFLFAAAHSSEGLPEMFPFPRDLIFRRDEFPNAVRPVCPYSMMGKKDGKAYRLDVRGGLSRPCAKKGQLCCYLKQATEKEPGCISDCLNTWKPVDPDCKGPMNIGDGKLYPITYQCMYCMFETKPNRCRSKLTEALCCNSQKTWEKFWNKCPAAGTGTICTGSGSGEENCPHVSCDCEHWYKPCVDDASECVEPDGSPGLLCDPNGGTCCRAMPPINDDYFPCREITYPCHHAVKDQNFDRRGSGFSACRPVPMARYGPEDVPVDCPVTRKYTYTDYQGKEVVEPFVVMEYCPTRCCGHTKELGYHCADTSENGLRFCQAKSENNKHYCYQAPLDDRGSFVQENPYSLYDIQKKSFQATCCVPNDEGVPKKQVTEEPYFVWCPSYDTDRRTEKEKEGKSWDRVRQPEPWHRAGGDYYGHEFNTGMVCASDGARKQMSGICRTDNTIPSQAKGRVCGHNFRRCQDRWVLRQVQPFKKVKSAQALICLAAYMECSRRIEVSSLTAAEKRRSALGSAAAGRPEELPCQHPVHKQRAKERNCAGLGPEPRDLRPARSVCEAAANFCDTDVQVRRSGTDQAICESAWDSCIAMEERNGDGRVAKHTALLLLPALLLPLL